MTNFVKLKRLISEQERLNEISKRSFFEQLKSIAENELRARQTSLENFGG